jgi:hypothetical protein
MAQIEQGLDPTNIEWEPVEATLTCPLEFGTPRKVHFQGALLDVSLELEGWTGVSPRGLATEEEDGDTLINDTIRTNQLDVNMHLL